MSERGEMREGAPTGRRELLEKHQSGFGEWDRLVEQEKLLLDEIVTNADRYTLEEYKTVLDQIKSVHQRREELGKQVNETFDEILEAA